MAAETIHDLLPIPAGIEKPHPYQVLGLEPGEQDPTKIKAAIHQRIAALKAARSETDAAVWNRAARLVNQSRAILNDPQKKAELDARFGIIAVAGAAATDTAPAETPAATAPADPLAPWLPSGDPLAAWVPEAQPEGGPEPSLWTDESAHETLATSAASHPANDTTPANDSAPASDNDPARDSAPAGHAAVAGTPSPGGDGFPLVVDSSAEAATVPRRRKSSTRLVLPAVTAALVLLVGGLAYFLFWGPGGIEVRSGQGQLTLSAKSNARAEQNAAADDRGQTASRPGQSSGVDRSRSTDPVVGGLLPERERPPRPGDSLAADLQANGIAFDAGENPTDAAEDKPGDTSGAPAGESPAGDSPQEETAEAGNETRADESASASKPSPSGAMEQAAQAEGMPAGDVMAGDGENDSQAANAGRTMPPGAASSPQQIDRLTAEADAAIERAIEQIRSAQWQQMKPVAEQAAEVAMTETQKEFAESLYQLADLATYYRGGIERAVKQLEAGDQIELTPALSVIVVDAGDDMLAIRRSARNYQFSLDELPLVLTDALAPYSMAEDDPTTVAAQAAYQAIVPLATDAHRQHAAESLRAITGEVEGADPERVAAAIERVFREKSQ